MYDSIIPSADTIPVHWFWFQALLIVTFFLHMILVNFLLGGTLLTAWDLITGKHEKRASGSIPTILALAVNLGVPPLLFVQVLYGHLFYSSSVMLAVPWILVIPIIIFAYYGAYLFVKKGEKAPLLSKIGLGISTLGLLYIAFVFVNNNTLALRPERWTIYFENPGGANLNIGEPTLWPRFLHFLIASIAIGALGRAIVYFFTKRDDEEKDRQVKRNLKIFGWFTLVQFAIGTWFWLSMPKPVWLTFMGASPYATILMISGWLVALLILHAAFTGRFIPAMILGGVQVFLMILIRDMARVAYLKDVFHPRQLENVNEASPLLVFLLVFAVGLLAIFYMIRLIFKSKTPQS